MNRDQESSAVASTGDLQPKRSIRVDLVDDVKDVHRRFPTGVTIVTTCVEGQPYGLAVNAFASVSLEPPAVLVCVAKTSATYRRLYASDVLAVNILSADQVGIARRFATSGGDKFAGIDWRLGTTGTPILVGACFLELEVEKRIVAYTHTIFIGRVVEAGVSLGTPLAYMQGRFFPLDLESDSP